MIFKQTGELAPANEPWTLIRDAIFDLRMQERLASVKVHMPDWHVLRRGICNQCLAGCVMSRRLNCDTNDCHMPSDFQDAHARLTAIDYFRQGNMWAAYELLDLPLPESLPDYIEVPPYEENPIRFKLAMLKLADRLEAAA